MRRAITVWLCDRAASTEPGDVHLSSGHNAVMTVRRAVANALSRLQGILKGMRSVDSEPKRFSLFVCDEQTTKP
jgi:hypothetical protein